jgi:hypothetical protein
VPLQCRILRRVIDQRVPNILPLGSPFLSRYQLRRRLLRRSVRRSPVGLMMECVMTGSAPFWSCFSLLLTTWYPHPPPPLPPGIRELAGIFCFGL